MPPLAWIVFPLLTVSKSPLFLMVILPSALVVAALVVMLLRLSAPTLVKVNEPRLEEFPRTSAPVLLTLTTPVPFVIEAMRLSTAVLKATEEDPMLPFVLVRLSVSATILPAEPVNMLPLAPKLTDSAVRIPLTVTVGAAESSVKFLNVAVPKVVAALVPRVTAQLLQLPVLPVVTLVTPVFVINQLLVVVHGLHTKDKFGDAVCRFVLLLPICPPPLVMATVLPLTVPVPVILPV